MRRRTWAAAGLGTLAGGVLGLVSLAFAAGRVIDAGVVRGPDPGSGALFLVGRGSMTILILVAGALGGAAIGGIAYAVGRLADPRERLYPAGPILLLSAVTGGVVAYAASRAAIGAAAHSIVDGTVMITVFRAAIAAVITGTVVGFTVGAGVERMARPSLYGFGGEAWPTSAGAFLRAAAPAVGLPVAAIIGAGAAIFGFSRLLLGASHLVALVLFSAAAAVILFGATAIAAREPKRRG
jgi:hypothetical protein